MPDEFNMITFDQFSIMRRSKFTQLYYVALIEENLMTFPDSVYFLFQ